MKRSVLIILVAVVAVFVIGASLAGTYNGLVTARENVDASFSGIATQLQRRLDLIPNLVNTVKGFAAQEKAVIDSVTEARSKLAGAASSGKVGEMAEADAGLSSALSRLLVVVENYPTLKSDANFRQLSDELAGTENRIAVSRKDYNDTVRTYNTRIRRFPTNLIAGMFGFDAAEYFEASENATEVPQVSF
ncbi:MAG TPA: LemA family protein [Clostridiales bacterium]|nr:LemA family protein [Clostridiales bacterium]